MAAALALCAGAALIAPSAAQAATARPHHTHAIRHGAARQAAPASIGAGAAFCNPYGGLSTSGDSLDGVYPCANPNIDDSFGYQCVEYSSRFESVVYGLGGVSGPGADVVDQLHANDNVPIASPGPGVLPVPGDVVSMWGAGQDPAGHTGVVSTVSVNASGTGTITYLDENGSLSRGASIGYDTIYVNNWTWSLSWRAPYAYNQFNFTEQGSTPAAPPGDLLRSGSFEASDAGWGTTVPTGATVNMVDYNTAGGAPANAHDGTWYLAFNSNAAGGGVYQDVPVNAAAGTAFVGTAWLSAQSGTATGQLCLWGLGASNTSNCIPYSVRAGSYKQVQVVYDAPENIGTVRFQVYPTAGGGTTDMDTASLK
jgi:hypothetical protein